MVVQRKQFMTKYIKLETLFKTFKQIEEVSAWLAETLPKIIINNSQEITIVGKKDKL